MARSVDQIVAELNSAYQPQLDQYNQQIAALPAQYAAQQSGLDVAKQNAFTDIGNMASAKGMSYSGVPIAEQSRYVGEKYLPAMAQLQQQQNQQKFGLTTAMNTLYQQRMSQAQALQQQELDREEQARQAEANRQAQLQAAQMQAAAAARSYSGGGGGSAARSSGTDWVKVIQEARQRAGGDKGWGATYDYLRGQLGIDFAPRGSAADQAFHQVFGR